MCDGGSAAGTGSPVSVEGKMNGAKYLMKTGFRAF